MLALPRNERSHHGQVYLLAAWDAWRIPEATGFEPAGLEAPSAAQLAGLDTTS